MKQTLKYYAYDCAYVKTGLIMTIWPNRFQQAFVSGVTAQLLTKYCSGGEPLTTLRPI